MEKFCTDCGRAIQEGDICVCKREGQIPQVSPNYQEQQPKSQINYNVNVPPTTVSAQATYQQPGTHQQPQVMGYGANGMQKFVAIGQIVTGGILFLFGMLTAGTDWSFISFVAGAGFIMTGTCELMGLIKK